MAQAAEPADPVRPEDDVIKTYRYLRIGMIGAVALLAASIAYERFNVDCWQTSISAYYYTPVRAIFVGSMMAVGLSLIVYKGRISSLELDSRTVRLNFEDICLNFAGMLAPVVAIAPTTDVGTCWSVEPRPLPINNDGSLAGWVVANIENNFNALLIAGGIALAVAAVITIVVDRSLLSPTNTVALGTRVSLAVTFLVLLVAWWLSLNWSDFNTSAHGYAAVGMFVFLIGAIIAVAGRHWQRSDRTWFRLYAAVAALMALGGLFIWLTRIFGEHTVFALETYEIVLFAVYWILQTKENWDEEVIEVDVDGAEAG